MAAIFGERKFFFFKLPTVHCLDTLWVKNFEKITLSHTVKEIEANLCFCIFGKNSKWPPFLGRGNFFWKIAKSTLPRYPVGRKFQQNRSISHGLGDRHIYVFCYVAITQLAIQVFSPKAIPSKLLIQ